MTETWALIPVKQPAQSKTRLLSVLREQECALLSRAMFMDVLTAVDQWFREHGEERATQSAQLRAALESINQGEPAADSLIDERSAAEIFRRSASAALARFDPLHGGFGGAPRFPQAPLLEAGVVGQLGDEHLHPPVVDGGVYAEVPGLRLRKAVRRIDLPDFPEVTIGCLHRAYVNPVTQQFMDSAQDLVASLRQLRQRESGG